MIRGILPFMEDKARRYRTPLLPWLGVSPDELAGVSEIAEMLGVTRATAARYVERDDFPEPYERLARGRVWRRDEVDAWGREKLPLRTGRPPKT
jgi:prophage regulatory protein